MLNMAISVLFKGNNFLRLCEGLWVTLRIALIAMAFSIVVGFIFGNCENYATACITVYCIFWSCKAFRN